MLDLLMINSSLLLLSVSGMQRKNIRPDTFSYQLILDTAEYQYRACNYK
jgi:hypothetical protein